MTCHRIVYPLKPKVNAKPRPPVDPSKRRPRNDPRYKALRAVVLAEETHCGICGGVVDKALRFPDKLSASLDHIVPVTLGGEWFDRANVRLAHVSCNASAGNQARANAALERLAFCRAALWLAERLAA